MAPPQRTPRAVPAPRRRASQTVQRERRLDLADRICSGPVGFIMSMGDEWKSAGWLADQAQEVGRRRERGCRDLLYSGSSCVGVAAGIGASVQERRAAPSAGARSVDTANSAGTSSGLSDAVANFRSGLGDAMANARGGNRQTPADANPDNPDNWTDPQLRTYLRSAGSKTRSWIENAERTELVKATHATMDSRHKPELSTATAPACPSSMATRDGSFLRGAHHELPCDSMRGASLLPACSSQPACSSAAHSRSSTLTYTCPHIPTSLLLDLRVRSRTWPTPRRPHALQVPRRQRRGGHYGKAGQRARSHSTGGTLA